MGMSPRNTTQLVLTQEGSNNKNQPTTSAGKDSQRMTCKFNFLDTKGLIGICLCFSLEGPLVKPFVFSTSAQCLLGM